MEISWDTRLSGLLVVVHEETRLWAGGPGLPTVELRNTGQERRRDVPIGTRRADDLTLTLDGRPCELRPGHGCVRRPSYRIGVTLPAGTLHLVPTTPISSRWVRGDRVRGGQDLGVVTRSESGDLDVDWIHDPEGNRLRRRAPLPTPDEVAVLGALAHGFGVGARLMVAALLAGMLELLS